MATGTKPATFTGGKACVGMAVVFKPVDDHGVFKKSNNGGTFSALVTGIVTGKQMNLLVFHNDSQPPVFVGNVPYNSTKENSWNYTGAASEETAGE